MKIELRLAVFVAAVLLGGCASTKFTEYHGADVFQGDGKGVVRDVDDIDFWEYGEPDRKYRILGLEEDRAGRRVPIPLVGRFSRVFSGSGDRDSAIARMAHKRGADAVIFVGGDAEAPEEGHHGGGSRGRTQKLLVIKYAGQPGK